MVAPGTGNPREKGGPDTAAGTPPARGGDGAGTSGMLREMPPTGIPGDAPGDAAGGKPWMLQEMQPTGTTGDALGDAAGG